MNLNRVIIVGNLTQDPELRTTPSGDSVANFGVATNRFWKNKDTGEKQQKAEFHNIVAWRYLADIAGQYLKKGSLVLVEGRIETRSWDDQSGQKRYRTEIVAENIQMGPRKGDDFQDSRPGEAQTKQKNSKKGAKNNEDDLPTVDADAQSDPDDEIDVKDIPF